MKKLCIFDLDGTLTDTLGAISHFGNSALKAGGFPEIEKERYKILVGNGRDLLVHRMLAEFGADTAENFERVGRAYDAAYEAEPLFDTRPYDGIPELIAALKSAGVTLAVLSNKPDNVVQEVVRLFFGGSFDRTFGQRAGVPIKPDPAAALEIARHFGAEADGTYFIGDTSVDIMTGKNAGFHTIGALWGFRTEQELSEAGAEFIASKPGDIAEIILK